MFAQLLFVEKVVDWNLAEVHAAAIVVVADIVHGGDVAVSVYGSSTVFGAVVAYVWVVAVVGAAGAALVVLDAATAHDGAITAASF